MRVTGKFHVSNSFDLVLCVINMCYFSIQMMEGTSWFKFNNILELKIVSNIIFCL